MPSSIALKQLDMFEQLLATPEDEVIVWTEQETLAFIDGFFSASISPILDNRCSPEHRKEVYDWMMEPLLHNTGTPVAFSFEACCLYLGICAEETRDLILAELRFMDRKQARINSAIQQSLFQPTA